MDFNDQSDTENTSLEETEVDIENINLDDMNDRDTCKGNNSAVDFNVDLDNENMFVDKGDAMCTYPNMLSEQKPFVGMEFQSDMQAYDFYNAYARVSGFSVRKNKSWYRKDGVGYRQFCCSKEGIRKYSDKQNNKIKKRGETRCGCSAKIEFKINHGIYTVMKFIEEHNHILHTPMKSHLLRSSKKITEDAKKLIKSWNSRGIAPASIHNVIAAEVGGYDKLGFNEEDVRSYIRQLARQTYGNDAKSMLEYFRSKQEENPGFFYSVQFDEIGQLCNCFWVDARARLDYYDFGEVVSFDTTYKKNKYLMPFAPFTGVNHHYQSIIFGCALLIDETEDSFVWLFKEWLRAMGNRPPISIINDQDPAMKAAIAKVFPNTVHRFCIWHILQKVPEKLGSKFREYDNLRDRWFKCIHQTDSVEDFEEQWSTMTVEFGLVEVDWIKTMWNLRHMWMSVYLKDTFFAGMSTTQRSESMNDFFKDWVNKNTSLNEFVKKYDMALLRRRESELRKDYSSANEHPVIITKSSVEEQLASVLTKTMFLKFQKELIATVGCSMRSIKQDGLLKKYEIEHDFNKKVYIVSYDESNQIVECSCRKFNFEGIICKHMFFVFRSVKILELPSRYILKRWRKDARTGVVHNDCGVVLQADSKKSMTVRYNDLMFLANKCAAAGAMCERSYAIMKEFFNLKLVEVNKVNKEEELLQAKKNDARQVQELAIDDTQNVDVILEPPSSEGIQYHHFTTSQSGSTNSITIRDPKIVKAKGSGKRIGRSCRTCNRPGHDSRNCPKKTKASTLVNPNDS